MEPELYIRSLNTQLTYLFAYARKINEIDTAAALSGESRGMQDAGWNTVVTAREVFGELKALATKGAPLTRAELRQVLCLYTQLSEAGGVYEGLLNIMRVAQLKAYNMWPFQDLVRVRQVPRAVIGPNSNAMFRQLASTAVAIGMPQLATLIEETFRDDVRNGIAHADYILVPQGLRLRRRNGGQPILVPIAEVQSSLQIALFFFELLQSFQVSMAETFRPARVIIGRFSANPPMPWTVELTDDGRFSISTDAPGPQVDDAYERQQRINDRLGGRMVTAYTSPAVNVPPALLEGISAAGFEALVVAFEAEEQFEALVSEVNEHRLWDVAAEAHNFEAGPLLATPDGFRRVSTVADFQAWLPKVEEIEVV